MSYDRRLWGSSLGTKNTGAFSPDDWLIQDLGIHFFAMPFAPLGVQQYVRTYVGTYVLLHSQRCKRHGEEMNS